MHNKDFIKEYLGNNINKLYDVVRVIDPVKKQVLDSNLEEGNNLVTSCYHFWKNKKMCRNCVSIRAYNENKTFVKIEYNGNGVYMLTAIPVQIDNKLIVIELLKDITYSGIIENIDNKDSATIRKAVNHMNELVVSDPLTNVFNKRFINERLPVDILDSYLNQKPLSLMMIDVDSFKKINDTYGHMAGDKVLKTIVSIFKNCIRKDMDWIARYGGDEFIICLKYLDNASAVKVAGRMRKLIEDTVVNFEKYSIKVTTSFGVKTLYGENLNSNDFIKEADHKLYDAKHKGKNNIAY